VTLLEITMHNLMTDGEIDLRDFLSRADVLAATGHTVLISDYLEYFRLVGYLSRYTDRSIAITLGAGGLNELFNEVHYQHLEGGTLEAFGRLFKSDVKVFVRGHPQSDDMCLVCFGRDAEDRARLEDTDPQA